MATEIAKLIESLRSLAKAIEASSTSNEDIKHFVGPIAPPLNRTELARLSTRLADRLVNIDQSRLSSKWSANAAVKNIDYLKSNIIPNFWNGHGVAAFQAYSSVLQLIRADFDSLFIRAVDWERLDDKDFLPTSLKKRLRYLNTSIKNIEETSTSIESTVKTINDAHETALSLPTDLENLEEARAEIELHRTNCQRDAVLAEEALTEARKELELISAARDDATSLVAETADAYRVATSMGLSESFQTRADRTATSMWIWVLGLIIALALSAYLGTTRVAIVEQMIKDKAPSGLTQLHTALAVISIAAPIWFAWLATKQIGQRFRVSEDYAFKASVARAYEGYRREAVNLDDTFQKRLFSSALDRLDEPPLRFVENETHGSPMHEWWKMRAAARRGAAEGVKEAMPLPVPSPAPPPPPPVDVEQTEP